MSESIKKYIEIIAALRSENILTNKGDFTGQIGAWLVQGCHPLKIKPSKGSFYITLQGCTFLQ